jgi:Flp pilus assembly pilin Flp
MSFRIKAYKEQTLEEGALRIMGRADQLKSILSEFLRQERGQDLIEYALISGLVVVVVAGFLPPALMPAVSMIFSKIASCMHAS